MSNISREMPYLRGESYKLSYFNGHNLTSIDKTINFIFFRFYTIIITPKRSGGPGENLARSHSSPADCPQQSGVRFFIEMWTYVEDVRTLALSADASALATLAKIRELTDTQAHDGRSIAA